MRISGDRALYLSRVLQKKLSADPKLLARVDVETLRRALAREDATGRRGLWLRALDAAGMGFDS